MEELNRTNQLAVLSHLIGDEQAQKLIAHVEAFDLDLLGNPQTLQMIARLPYDAELPTNKGDLYEKAIDKLWCEHRTGRGSSELDREAALDAAGAAFAILILTGSSAIVRHGAAHLGDNELALAEVEAVAGGNVSRILASRLFEGGEDSFIYWHRSVGEFLGARWLAKRADTQGKRRRMLSLFHSHKLVPASLRGLHAWLARDSKLASEVIAADPLGLIEYGDADTLSPDHAQALFAAMLHLFQETSEFHYWSHPRARALVQGALQADADRVIRDRAAPFAFRMLLLKQLTEASIARKFLLTLRSLLYDTSEVFAIRHEAGIALTRLQDETWSDNIEKLRAQGTGNSVRLAFELMTEIGISAFTDEEIISAIFAYEGLTISAVPQETSIQPAGHLWNIGEIIPTERLGDFLDVFSRYAVSFLPFSSETDHHALIDLANKFIIRWLDENEVDPIRLWSFLEPYAEQYHYRSDKEGQLAIWFTNHQDARRVIQQHVLLGCPANKIWHAYSILRRVSSALLPTDDDAAALIEGLPISEPPDERWKHILNFIEHDANAGSLAREAAKRFAAADPELVREIDQLSVRTPATWEIEDADRQRRATARKATQSAEAQQLYRRNLEEVSKGAFRWVYEPARIYLKLLLDTPEVDQPHLRITAWLGEDITSAVLAGFEAFLCNSSARPNAVRIAIMNARARNYFSSYVITAALAERVRTQKRPFTDLTDERVIAGTFALWSNPIHDHAGFPELRELLEDELRHRDCLDRALRLFVAAQLKRHRTEIYPLRDFMQSGRDLDLAVNLALDWLRQCTDIPAAAEVQMVYRVLQSPRRHELLAIWNSRCAVTMDEERKRNWDAVQILIDINGAKSRLSGDVQPALLWHLRTLSSARRGDDRTSLNLAIDQIAWIVGTFRECWRFASFPAGSSWGDEHPWHATEYLNSLIAQLGENSSDEAQIALEALRDMPADGYTDRIKQVLAEQRRKRVEQTYIPPKITEIRAIIEAAPPITSSDLQAVMLENLETVQKRLKSDPIDWYRGFFKDDGKNHKDEESCRDELLKMLEAIDSTLEYTPEQHGADDKRVDIVARHDRQPILPIEIKGTWHAKLWTAADEQLDHLYVNDWRAERGIYLILWFGEGTLLTAPPGSRPHPTTPEELREAIQATSRAAQGGRIDIVVLDLTRPTKT